MIANVCDTGMVPPDYLGIRLAGTDNPGPGISFPSQWLREGKLSVTQAGAAMGYPDSVVFAREFRRFGRRSINVP